MVIFASGYGRRLFIGYTIREAIKQYRAVKGLKYKRITLYRDFGGVDIRRIDSTGKEI